MIKLDDDLLAELGLASLPEEEKKKMLAHIYETLEMRVGMELAKQMSDAQLNEFEQFITRNDEAGALRWLETNFPNYKDVVAAEFEKLKAEIKQLAPQILADAAAASGAGAQPQQQPVNQQIDPYGSGTGVPPQYAPQHQPPQYSYQQPSPSPYPQPTPQPYQQQPAYGAPAQPQAPSVQQQPAGPAPQHQQQIPSPYQQYPPQSSQQPPYLPGSPQRSTDDGRPQQPPYQSY